MERIARSLPRFAQVALILVLATGMMATTGCGWLKGKKKQQPVQEQVAPKGPENAPLEHYKGELAPLPQMKVIYFAYDKSAIKTDQVDAMEANLKFLKDNPEIKCYITGHCDERGSVEYNFNLGMRRATAVKDYYVSKGIPAERIEVGSKGKEQPAVVGKGEAAYAKNRRAEFQRMY
ncbi:MAG: OmpA family protein [Candidatus Sumerlaeia bacterium]